jgi:hypothetical protein
MNFDPFKGIVGILELPSWWVILVVLFHGYFVRYLSIIISFCSWNKVLKVKAFTY